MDKISTPVEKAARLLDLVPFISSHQGIALVDLASQFGISESELISDLNTLWMCGLPGYTPLELIDLEFESGFVSIRNAEILQKVRTLAKEELVVLAIGLDLLVNTISRDRPDLQSILLALQEKIRELIGQVASVESLVDSADRAVVFRAIHMRSDLKITYHSLIRDAFSERQITPIEVTTDFGHEVLRAYCHSVKEYRSFRLDNIKKIELCEKSVNTQRPQESNDYVVDFQVVQRVRSTLERFRISLVDQEMNAAHIFQAKSFSQDWLTRNALSTLASVVILAPEIVRTQLAHRCQKLLAIYSDPAFVESVSEGENPTNERNCR